LDPCFRCYAFSFLDWDWRTKLSDDENDIILMRDAKKEEEKEAKEENEAKEEKEEEVRYVARVTNIERVFERRHKPYIIYKCMDL